MTQILLGDYTLNSVQYGASLHLSMQNVWGLTFFCTYYSYIWIEKLRIRSVLQLQPMNATNTYKENLV